MAARIIDGKACADSLTSRLARTTADLQTHSGLTPALTVLIAGDDPASQIYVRNKARRAEATGITSHILRLPADVSQDTLLEHINTLNADPGVHGILVQFPTPPHLDRQRIVEAIRPAKDVDGLHPINAGRLASGHDAITPCTPQGCILLLRHADALHPGQHAVIVGRSALVGRPLGILLLAEDCTVTLTHSKTRNLDRLCRGADILIACAGRPEMISADWIKPGAAVVDVGINRVENAGRARITGDVEFTGACAVAGCITPVPGGVGPMTIACLMANTVRAACRQNGLAPPL